MMLVKKVLQDLCQKKTPENPVIAFLKRGNFSSDKFKHFLDLIKKFIFLVFKNPKNGSEVANFMNETFCKPVTGDSARLNERRTFVTPSAVHTLSEYQSIKGVRSHYCYLIIPNSPFIWFCRYTCTSCVKCKALDFLNCINERCGK